MKSKMPNNRFLLALSGAILLVVTAGCSSSPAPDGFDSIPDYSWNVQASHTTADLESIIYAAGRFVVVGHGGTILTSTDARNWTTVSSPTTEDLLDVTYGDGKFVAVGTQGVTLVSNDGINWQTGSTGTNEDLRSVACGNARCVALSRSSFYYSTDGLAWQQTPAEVQMYVVNYIGAKFYAWGISRNYESFDGQQWTAYPFEPGTNMVSLITYTYVPEDQQFFVIDSHHRFYRSYDLRYWNDLQAGYAYDFEFDSALAYGEHILMAVNGDATYEAAYSHNTFYWTGHDLPFLPRDIIFKDHFIIVGEKGGIAIGKQQ